MPEIKSPMEYGVPHETWRPAQYEAFKFVNDHRQKIRDQEDVPKYMFVELPTGSGKSGIGTALGHDGKVTILVHTLALLDQYRDIYGFSVVKGMQEYDCCYPGKVKKWSGSKTSLPTAADCHYPKKAECPVADECAYLIARNQALKARRTACTYRYAALSRGIQIRPGLLILDEAHSAPAEWLSFAAWEVHDEARKGYDLAPFPYASGYGENNKGGILTTEAIITLSDWFAGAIRKTHISPKPQEEQLTLGMEPAKESVIKDIAPAEIKKKQFNANLQKALTNIVDGMEYFYESGQDVGTITKKVDGYRQRIAIPGMKLRALTAAPVAHKVWHYKEAIMFMSATIGEPTPLARQLGIDDFVHKTFPHPIPLKNRPVYNLGMGRMTANLLKKNPGLYSMQARLIKGLIDQFPDTWRGLILTSSFTKIKKLVAKLHEWYPYRIFDPERKIWGGRRVEAFLDNKMPGLIAVETIQGWGQGLDFKGDQARFIILAGVQFGNYTDPYIQARRSQDKGGNWYFYEAYNSVVQGAGRVVRGAQRADGSIYTNIVAIADGSAMSPTSQRFYPEWFKEAIQPMDRENLAKLLAEEPEEEEEVYTGLYPDHDDIPF